MLIMTVTGDHVDRNHPRDDAPARTVMNTPTDPPMPALQLLLAVCLINVTEVARLSKLRSHATTVGGRHAPRIALCYGSRCHTEDLVCTRR